MNDDEKKLEIATNFLARYTLVCSHSIFEDHNHGKPRWIFSAHDDNEVYYEVEPFESLDAMLEWSRKLEFPLSMKD